MKTTLNLTFLSFILPIAILGCSSSGDPSVPPSIPSINLSDSPDGQLQSNIGDPVQNNHNLWSYNLIYIDNSDPENIQAEIIPVRQTETHWNILKWLEQTPCTDCLQILSLTPSGSGTLLAEVEISHPFSNANFTGFDVRGISIFNASDHFPSFDLTYSNRDLGDGELVNADGYTTLYNALSAGSGPGGLQGYIKGKSATMTVPDSELNGYVRYASSDPANTRNAFYAGESVTVIHEIDMPDGPFVFGYAVDASWAPPLTTPVTDPMVDFGPEANSPEPWKVTYSQGPGLTSSGGTATFYFNIYDFGGDDDWYNVPFVECPELFDGMYGCQWTEDFPDYIVYRCTFSNDNLAPAGTYDMLLKMLDTEATDPLVDFSAYQIISVEVIPAAPMPTDITPDDLNFSAQDIKVSGNTAYLASRNYGLHTFDITDPENPAWLAKLEIDGLCMSLELTGTNVILVTQSPNNLYIIDVSDPMSPSITAQTPISSYAQSVLVDGGYAYISDGYSGLSIVDIDPIDTPVIVKTVDTPGAAYDTVVNGGYAYVADDNEGLHIIDIDPIDTASIVKTIPVTENHAWGVEYTGGYVIVADYPNYMHIVDVEPIASASIVQSLDVGGGTYDCVIDSGNAYVATGNNLHILDISTPSSTTVTSTVLDTGWNVDIDYQSGYVFLADWGNGLEVFDVSTPAAPLKNNGAITPGGASDVSVFGNYAYVSNGNGVPLILDVTDPASASVAYVLDGIPSSYESESQGEYIYGATHTQGLVVVDVVPPDTATVVDTITSIWTWSVVIEGNYAYVGSESTGLSIIDISIPSNIIIETQVPTTALARQLDISNGYAVVSCFQVGVDIIDIDPPGSASLLINVPTSDYPTNVDIWNDYAFVAVGTSGVDIIDISDPGSASMYSNLPTTDKVWDVVVANGFAFLASGDAGLEVYDVDPIADATWVGNFELPIQARAIKVVGNILYITHAGTPGGVQILELP